MRGNHSCGVSLYNPVFSESGLSRGMVSHDREHFCISDCVFLIFCYMSYEKIYCGHEHVTEYKIQSVSLCTVVAGSGTLLAYVQSVFVVWIMFLWPALMPIACHSAHKLFVVQDVDRRLLFHSSWSGCTASSPFTSQSFLWRCLFIAVRDVLVWNFSCFYELFVAAGVIGTCLL